MMKTKLLPIVMATALLFGCGGDDNDVVGTQPEVPEQPETPSQPHTGTGVFEDVWGPDIRFKLEGPLYIYLETNTREDMLQQYQGGTPPNAIQVDPGAIRDLLPTLWSKEEFERRIYLDDQVTVADILLYLGATRDDFEVSHRWNDELSTYQFSVSFDMNGDGDFDDEGDSLANPNWYASYVMDFGHFRREVLGTSRGEALYRRLELTHVQPDSGILFRSYSPAMTKRRESIQKEQADRRRANEAKYGANTIVFPKVEINPIGQEPLIFEDVVVKTHDLRPDIYKRGAAITLADILMSMDEQGLIDIGYSYWGKLATDVNVQHFFLNEINGQKAYGSVGYLAESGVSWARQDFNNKYVTTMLTWGKGTMPSYCDWTGQPDPYGDTKPGGWGGDHGGATSGEVPDGLIDADNPECDPETTDITDWFADQEFHFFTDVWVVNYPGDYAKVVNFSMYGLFAEEDSQRVAGDGRWPIYDIKDARAPLTEEHLGWGIADCAICHSLEGIHSSGDMGTLGVNATPVYIRDNVQSYPLEDDGDAPEIAPYQCAQCHGSNGAPEGHGEIARCFWCHSEEFVPQNHGSVSGYTTFGEITGPERPAGNDQAMFNTVAESVDVLSTDTEALAELQQSYQEKHAHLPWVDSIRFDILAPNEGITWQGHWGKYPDDMKVRTNSDWFTDPTYPDPYSCMTCHPNTK